MTQLWQNLMIIHLRLSNIWSKKRSSEARGTNALSVNWVYWSLPFWLYFDVIYGFSTVIILMHRNNFHKNKIRVYFCCGHRGIHSHSLIYSQLINGHIGPIWNPKPGAINEKLHEHQSHVFINVCVWEEKYSFYAFNNQLKKEIF